MLNVLFTLDYEIHGNGDGSPYALMVEPTARMLNSFDEFGAKLTIMADVAEILKFQEHKTSTGQDLFHYDLIVAQLREAIHRGHDVQLHLHTSYLKAQYKDGRWVQDWSEYDVAGLSYERLMEIIGAGKRFLETLLQPVKPNYKCNVFRAANWAMCPSTNIVRALIDNEILIDTSVFKYGKRAGLVNFDYSEAWSPYKPWPASEENICFYNTKSRLFEFPIYSENRWLGAFLTPQRLYRGFVSKFHRFKTGEGPIAPVSKAKARNYTQKQAWKADFNQCSGGQLIRALRRVPESTVNLPFVLIGHSKLFTRFNEWDLRRFLAFVAQNPEKYRFGTFGDFNLTELRAQDERNTQTNPRSLQFSS